MSSPVGFVHSQSRRDPAARQRIHLSTKRKTSPSDSGAVDIVDSGESWFTRRLKSFVRRESRGEPAVREESAARISRPGWTDPQVHRLEPCDDSTAQYFRSGLPTPHGITGVPEEFFEPDGEAQGVGPKPTDEFEMNIQAARTLDRPPPPRAEDTLEPSDFADTIPPEHDYTRVDALAVIAAKEQRASRSTTPVWEEARVLRRPRRRKRRDEDREEVPTEPMIPRPDLSSRDDE